VITGVDRWSWTLEYWLEENHSLKLEAKTCGVREVRGNVCQYKVTISFGVRGVGVCFMRVLQGYSRDA